MTFISKLPVLFLKTFFPAIIMLFAFLSIEANANVNGNNFLAILILVFLILCPFKKAREVFGATDLTAKAKPLVFASVGAATAISVLITLFFCAAFFSVLLPEPHNKNAFSLVLGFLTNSHLLAVFALIIYIIYSGLARWFFAETEAKEEISYLDKWQKLFNFILYISSILILVSDAEYSILVKTLFTVSFFIAMQEERKNLNEYFG